MFGLRCQDEIVHVLWCACVLLDVNVYNGCDQLMRLQSSTYEDVFTYSALEVAKLPVNLQGQILPNTSVSVAVCCLRGISCARNVLVDAICF